MSDRYLGMFRPFTSAIGQVSSLLGRTSPVTVGPVDSHPLDRERATGRRGTWRARAWLTLASMFAVVSPAAGQARPLWLVSIGDPSGDPSNLDDARAGQDAALTTLLDAGLDVTLPERASERFESMISRPPSDISQRQIDDWAALSTSAIRNVARGDYDQARADLEQTLGVAASAVEELSREANRARQVLDTCLLMVRTYVETREFDRAELQARSCRSLSPRTEPTTTRHPPEALAVLARIDAEIAAGPRGRLVVRSEPAGCTVRINGMPIGDTPLQGEGLSPGHYRLQVECASDHRGRVRTIEVRAGETTTIELDLAFDRAVDARPFLHVRARDGATAHARRLTRLADVDVVLLERSTAGNWMARVVREGQETDFVPLDALPSLLRAPAAVVSASSGPDLREGPPSTRPRWPGAVLLGLGAAGAVATVAGTLAQLGCGETFDSGRCRVDRELAPIPFVAWLGLSAVTALGGVLYLTLGRSSRAETTLSLGPANLRLRHVF